jgi:cytochrome c2
MKKRIHIFTAVGALLALAVAGAGAAADVAAGRKLAEERCVACHKVVKYTAPGRKVTTLDALKERVAACAAAAKLPWTDAQKADVTAYLNQEYYHFEWVSEA